MITHECPCTKTVCYSEDDAPAPQDADGGLPKCGLCGERVELV